METVVNKFINGIDECVDDSLRGLVLGDSNLRFHPQNPRVILRHDLDDLKRRGIVGLISLGGSGHEPAFAGFVGSNALTASVSGALFAAPPPAHIADALVACYSNAGTIVILNNYTGDRLNLGIGLERFRTLHAPEKRDNLAVEMIFVDDDVALEEENEKRNSQLGARGLAGCAVVLHCAGVWAEQEQWSYDRLLQELRHLISNTATIGISLGPCALPGHGRLFEMPNNEVEIGLGIHGEKGVERRGYEPIRELVDVVMQRLIDCQRLSVLDDSTPLVLLLNNLGTCTQLEMLIIQGELIQWLQKRGFNVARLLSGTLVSSLDGHGFSVTIIKCTEPYWLHAIDAKSIISSQWKSTRPFVLHDNPNVISPSAPPVQQLHVPVEQLGVQVSIACAHTIRASLIKACERVIEYEESSNNAIEGKTLASSAQHIISFAQDGKFNFARPAAFCLELAALLEQTAGGTQGSAYSQFFIAASNAFSDTFDDHHLRKALNYGYQAIQRAVSTTPQ
ncbi:hypothetical protein M3Y94_00201500 [Aphelenchoides besseyi]|nr:hypothetical protein M3Y94_00201500 [Aphelenchoides besseyi]